MVARYCTNRRCKRRLNFHTASKGRCTNCLKPTTRLKYQSQVEAADSNRLLWFGNKLVIKQLYS